MSSSAFAGPVGIATEARSNTNGVNGPGRYMVTRGTRVNSDDMIETDAEGRARFQFFDQTLLTLGPLSRVKLDRFVVRQDGGVSSMVLNASRGAFRFATGVSGSRSYSIVTPSGVIGVRGTRFSFKVSNGGVQVSVNDGAVELCATSGGTCRLARAGQTLSLAGNRFVLRNGVTNLAGIAPPLGATIANLGTLIPPPGNVAAPVQRAANELPRVSPLAAGTSGVAAGAISGGPVIAPGGGITGGVGAGNLGAGNLTGGLRR